MSIKQCFLFCNRYSSLFLDLNYLQNDRRHGAHTHRCIHTIMSNAVFYVKKTSKLVFSHNTERHHFLFPVKMSKTRGSAWENQKPRAIRFPHPSFKLCFLIRWFCKRKTQQWKITSWWDVRETSVTNMVQNFIDFSFHKMFLYTQAWWKSRAVQTEYVFLFYPQDSYKKLYFCQYRYTLSLCLYAFTVYVFETHQIISELCYLVVRGGGIQ